MCQRMTEQATSESESDMEGVDQHEFIQAEMAAEQMRALDAVFKPEFVQALLRVSGGVTTAIGPLARAMGALARMELLTVFCHHSEEHRTEQTDGAICFHADVTSACPNGNVQLNCE